MAERHKVFDDLPAAVPRIRQDAGESGHLAVEQHEFGPRVQRSEFFLGQPGWRPG